MNTKQKRLLSFSTASLALGAVVIAGISGSKISNPFGLKADEDHFICTIDKDSVRDTVNKKVTGLTNHGNSNVFTYEAFDTRPDPGDWSEAICFYGSTAGAKYLGHGGYIKNDTEMKGIKEVRVYGYDNSDHNKGVLTGSSFELYYGYEPITQVGSGNYTKVTFTGSYTFPEGLEVPYIALVVNSTIDTLCEKVEIEQLCEDVIGTSESHSGDAYQYSAGTYKEFTYSNGTKVKYDEYDRAPWARTPLANFELVASTATNNSGHTPVRTLTDESVDLQAYYNAGLRADIGSESEGRNIISITLKGTKVSWGLCFYMYIYSGATQISPVTQIFNNAAGTQKWISNGGRIINSAGVRVTSVNYTDYFTYEMDLSSKLTGGKKITAVTVVSGYSDNDSSTEFANVPTLSIKDLTFKATDCGHSERQVTSTTTDAAKGYIAQGTYNTCTVCGKVHSITDVVAEAPWKLLEPSFDSAPYAEEDGAYTLNGKSNALYYQVPTTVQGTRTELAITAKTTGTSYEFFYISATGASSFSQLQFFSPDKGSINYSKGAQIKAILNSDGANIYDSSAYTNVAGLATDEVTIIIDLTNEICSGIQQLKIFGCAAGTQGTFKVSLRTPVDVDNYPVCLTPTWDVWNSTITTKTNGANFTVTESADANGTCTLGNYGSTYLAKNFPDSTRMVRRLRFKMVKDLENPETAGSMQWYFLFSGGSAHQLVLGNASTAFAQHDDMHVLDMNGNLIADGSQFAINTYYQIELLFDSDNMPNHIQIRAEGVSSATWGYGSFIVEGFNVCLTQAQSSFAA